jgi:hypothetical protein
VFPLLVASGLRYTHLAGVQWLGNSPQHGGAWPKQGAEEMGELIRTNDPVVISLARALLEAEGFLVIEVDSGMSVMEGSIGVFPRRLLVVTSELAGARALITEAGLGAWLFGP